MSAQESAMQLSLIIRGQHKPGDIAAHLRDDLELVRRADQLGFDGIVKGSHYSAHPFEYVQQIPFLAYAAAIAPRLRLICGRVLVPLHKPLDLAEQLATLDIMSNGRLVFGCGIGYRDVEFKAFGVPRAGLGRRFEECLEAVKRLWTEDFVPMRREVFVAPSRAEAIRRAQPYLEEKYKAYRAWGQDKVMPAGDDFDHGFADLLEDRFLLGSPSEVAEQIVRLYRRLGVNHIVASVHWPGMPNNLALDQLQILAEEVMPQVRRAV